MSPRRLRANKQNAQLSTGPRSVIGLAVSSQNATRHGFGVARVVLDGLDDAGEYDRLASSIVADLGAVGASEVALAERFAELLWRLRRVTRFETEYLSQWHRDILPDEVAIGRLAEALSESERMTNALGSLMLSGKTELSRDLVCTIRAGLMVFVGPRERLFVQESLASPLALFMCDPLPTKKWTVRQVQAALTQADDVLSSEHIQEPAICKQGSLLARLYQFWAAAGREWRLHSQDADRETAAKRTAALMYRMERMSAVERYEPRLRRDLSRTLADLHALQDRRKARGSSKVEQSLILRNEPIPLSGSKEGERDPR